MANQQSVLERLLASNEEWSRDIEKSHPGIHQRAASGQWPKVLWIGCSDSRVPESVVTNVKPGEIFVHRNIANQFHLNDKSALAVLQYAVEQLHVEHVIVVGHSHCGGADAALSASLAATGGKLIPVPSHPASDPINVWLLPLTRLAASLHLDAESGLQKLVEENVKVQVANVVEAATIQKAWKEGKAVSVHGWVFDIEHGRLRDLGVSRSALRLPMPSYASNL